MTRGNQAPGTTRCGACDGTGLLVSEEWVAFQAWRRERPTLTSEDEDDLVERYFIELGDHLNVPPMSVPCEQCGGMGLISLETPTQGEREEASNDGVSSMATRGLSAELHEVFLPYTEHELLSHFVATDADAEDPSRHLTRWKRRIADAPAKDPSFLHRDETLWTAGALLAIQRGPDAHNAWRRAMSLMFGPVPPVTQRLEWDDLIDGDLELFFEVGLRSPTSYRNWLSRHLHDRQALETQRAVAGSKGTALEGRTHLDALLLCPTTGFAVHFEAKVLSDIDTKTTNDSLRNQLARNIDCMVNEPSEHALLRKRDPSRSFLVLLTPELFRRNWRSRLYGHLIREYAGDPAALERDLPHLDGLTCASVSRRLGWLTFEDVRTIQPAACPWL